MYDVMQQAPEIASPHTEIRAWCTSKAPWTWLEITLRLLEPRVFPVLIFKHDEGKRGDLKYNATHILGAICGCMGMFARRAPGACPGRYLCIEYPTLAPRLSPPREVPQVDRTRPPTFRAEHVA